MRELPLKSASRRTRLAPSPTGALHLGNARTFMINWAIARQYDWSIVLRIEDLDHPRVKPATIDLTRTDLEWLGIDWDDEVALQSSDLSACHQALVTLGETGRIYPCNYSRSEVEAAQSAPHEGGDLCYPSHLRPESAGIPTSAPDPNSTWRILVEDREIEVVDQFAGQHIFNLAQSPGDFPIWTNRGPAYQLAVMVDDARQGITDVIRGDDLLPSAARQEFICEALDLPIPDWWHLPLVRGSDGLRLAKRHGDTRLSSFREAGIEADRIIGLLATWSGITSKPAPMDAATFRDALSVRSIPRTDCTLQQEDLKWLAD